jgi:hypothetical protein
MVRVPGTVRWTVRTADLLVPFAFAVIVESESVPTADVDTVKVADVWPAATVTVDGTEADVPVLLMATTSPAVGAGPVIVTTAELELPPITDDGVNVIASTVGRFTLSVAVFVTPFADALSVAVTFDATETVDADVTALDAPSTTVIDAGTTTEGLLDDNATTNPPAGAGPASVTETSAELPPITDPGVTVSVSTTLRSTVT